MQFIIDLLQSIAIILAGRSVDKLAEAIRKMTR